MKIQSHQLVNIAEFGGFDNPHLQIAIMRLTGFNANGHARFAISEQDLKTFRVGGSAGLRINAKGYHVFTNDSYSSVNAEVHHILKGGKL